MRQTQRPGKLATLVAALLAALASCVALPIPVAAQQVTARSPIVLEQYLSRARLNPAVAGGRTQLTAFGARLLYPAVPPARQEPGALASRLSLGGFLTYAPATGNEVAATHFGAAAELRLRRTPIAGRVEPLLSLGAGAFRTRYDARGVQAVGGPCLRPLDLAVPGTTPHCFDRGGSGPSVASTDPAVSPAVAVRVGLLPGLAFRADLRDVVVYRGAPRHNAELAMGFSVVR